MKKGMFSSYISGIINFEHGESYATIMRYFVPEFISAFVIYSLPLWVDAWFIGQLASTPAYATLGTTNSLIHFIFKLAESFSVGTVIMTGQFNGQQAYDKAGRTLRDSFWTTCMVGLFFAGSMYLGAFQLYRWYGVPAEIAHMGVPFLRLRAIGIFFIFVYMAFVGFLRGIKNTKVPMAIFMVGAIAFLVSDYLFIFGNFGAPAMGLQGSALSSVIQYAIMVLLAAGYVSWRSDYKHYAIDLFQGVTSWEYVKRLVSLSWPIMIDKATMAWSYVWLYKMINPMGTCVIASFCALKDMERFAFLPALACAQVITLLVSNDYGMGAYDAIKANLKKISFIAAMMMTMILVAFSLNPARIIQFFDKTGEFTPLAVAAFPFVSVLVFLDLIQLILAGALRGAGNVRMVMQTRLLICIGFFIPVSYLLSNMQMPVFTKFILIYSSFYVGNALMSVVYIRRFRSDEWQVSSTEGNI